MQITLCLQGIKSAFFGSSIQILHNYKTFGDYLVIFIEAFMKEA